METLIVKKNCYFILIVILIVVLIKCDYKSKNEVFEFFQANKSNENLKLFKIHSIKYLRYNDFSIGNIYVRFEENDTLVRLSNGDEMAFDKIHNWYKLNFDSIIQVEEWAKKMCIAFSKLNVFAIHGNFEGYMDIHINTDYGMIYIYNDANKLYDFFADDTKVYSLDSNWFYYKYDKPLR